MVLGTLCGRDWPLFIHPVSLSLGPILTISFPEFPAVIMCGMVTVGRSKVPYLQAWTIKLPSQSSTSSSIIGWLSVDAQDCLQSHFEEGRDPSISTAQHSYHSPFATT